ncbi:MAG: S9 family peptidase, partial [Sphingobacteriaceae bacterium]
ENLKFTKDEKSIQFDLKSSVDVVKKDRKDKKAADSLEKKIFYFQYNLQTGQTSELANYEKVKPKPMWASIAPDSSAIIFARNYNLFWMDKFNYKKALKNEDDSTIVEHQLTKDGVKDYAYGGSFMNETNVEEEKNKKKRKPTQVLWSPDARHFAMIRSDNRKLKDFWVINSVAEPRPTLETYKYQVPGEKENPIKEMLLFDFPAKTSKKLNVAVFKDQELSMWPAPTLQKNRDDEFRPNLWLGNNNQFYFYRTGRDLKKIDVCKVDIQTSKVDLLIQERLNTYIEINRPGLVNDGKEIVEWSERDGWAHFYLYDESGKLKNQITSGSFHCDDIVNIDAKNRTLYFTASGREVNENPYYTHLYSIKLDGSNMRLLDAGNFDHASSLNDDSKFFVNTFSRVNT